MSGFEGFVPLYELHDARLSAGYTLPGWEALPYWDKVIEVAMFRLRNLVEGHQQAAIAAKTKSNMNKRPRR